MSHEEDGKVTEWVRRKLRCLEKGHEYIHLRGRPAKCPKCGSKLYEIVDIYYD
jgi:Zn finger protein HypA/HybF involved in hydrogenase expression